MKAAAKTRNEARWRGAGREWATPPELFSELDSEFRFNLDPCATDRSAKCRRFFTESDDGLSQNWGKSRVFLNPPYGREIPAWIAKARESAEAGALVVGLLPASTDSAWWHEHVIGHAEVRYLRKRPRFLVYLQHETKWASPFQPCVVVIWRPHWE
jgi:phage N-6-adenine-methyltransferase